MTLKEAYGRVCAYAEEHKRQMTEELRTLVRVPSVRGPAEPGAPYGRECARALETVKEIFAAHGVGSEIRPESGYLIADVGEGARCLGLFAHSDVVPVDDKWTLGEPFGAELREGCVIGRGALDDKSGVIVSLYAALAIRDLGLPMDSRIRLVVGSAEETGMPDMRRFAAEQPMPDASLVPDMGFPAYRGEKGILRFWAVSRRRSAALRDFSGGLAPNVILGLAKARLAWSPELEAALSGLGEAFTCEREGDELVLAARGTSKHAAHPDGSVSAAWLLTGALAGCPALPEAERDLMARAHGLLEGYHGEGLDIMHTDPDFSELTCGNGLICLRDGRPALSFDIRYGTSIGGDELIERIRRRLDAAGFEADLSLGGAQDGFLIPEDDPALTALLRCWSEITGEAEPKAKLAFGGTYARELKHAFSIGQAFRGTSPFQLPAGHGAIHQPDEHASVEGLVNAVPPVAAMLIALDREKG